MGSLKIDELTAQISLAKEGLDYERRFKYYLMVEAIDNGPGNLTAGAKVTVMVNDVNEVPRLRDVVLMTSENVPIGTELNTPTGRIEAIDPDIGDEFSYAFKTSEDPETFATTTADGLFTIDAQTGTVRTASASLNFEQNLCTPTRSSRQTRVGSDRMRPR